MPQPKKSASSTREPAARRPASAKNARTASAPKQAAAPRQAAPEPPVRAEPEEAQQREEHAPAAALLRDVLSRGIVITTDRLQEIVEDAIRRGRMTRQDAEELVQNLVAIGRRQAQDALTELEALVERSAKQTRRQAHARVQDAGSAARRAAGTDRALRTVDRVRRAAGLGHAFPVIGYEQLTSAQVIQRLDDLDPAELRKVRDHERRNANRQSVLTAIERRLQ